MLLQSLHLALAGDILATVMVLTNGVTFRLVLDET